MSHKTSNARRAAFFAALAETGNQTIAAERAKVSRSWVSLHRANDPAFKADMLAAIAVAKARLADAAGVQPDAGWRSRAGEELTVRGSNGRRTQVARARVRQWTPRVEARFLAALVRCCNVHRACAVVGLSVPSVYGHRKRWPEFGRRWDEAIEDGYDALSFATVAAAGAMLGDADMVPEPDMEPPTTAQALEALRLYKRRMRGEPYRRGWRPRPRTLDEVRGSILKKLDAIAGAARHEARLAGRDPDACLHCGGVAHSGGSAGSC